MIGPKCCCATPPKPLESCRQLPSYFGHTELETSGGPEGGPIQALEVYPTNLTPYNWQLDEGRIPTFDLSNTRVIDIPPVHLITRCAFEFFGGVCPELGPDPFNPGGLITSEKWPLEFELLSYGDARWWGLGKSFLGSSFGEADNVTSCNTGINSGGTPFPLIAVPPLQTFASITYYLFDLQPHYTLAITASASLFSRNLIPAVPESGGANWVHGRASAFGGTHSHRWERTDPIPGEASFSQFGFEGELGGQGLFSTSTQYWTHLDPNPVKQTSISLWNPSPAVDPTGLLETGATILVR